MCMSTGHSCGGCQFFQKVKPRYGSRESFGLCGRYDMRTGSDHGHSCTGWKARGYNRKDEKIKLGKEIKEEENQR